MNSVFTIEVKGSALLERYGSVLKLLCLLALCFKSVIMRFFEIVVFLAGLVASHPRPPW